MNEMASASSFGIFDLAFLPLLEGCLNLATAEQTVEFGAGFLGVNDLATAEKEGFLAELVPPLFRDVLVSLRPP